MKGLTVEELQEKEKDLWDSLTSELGSSQIDLLSELIEVNIEIEKHCNQ